MKSYSYRDLDGLIDIVTLSPSEKYYYKIQKPVSINMSNFGCKISFFDNNNQLLYFRNDTFAHWLKPWQTINVVLWSKQGNMAYFYEYSRNRFYESVFLNLRENYCYRIDEMQNDFAFVNSLYLQDTQYDENTIIKKLADKRLHQQPLIKDKLPRPGLFEKLFGINKWYPDAKV